MPELITIIFEVYSDRLQRDINSIPILKTIARFGMVKNEYMVSYNRIHHMLL